MFFTCVIVHRKHSDFIFKNKNFYDFLSKHDWHPFDAAITFLHHFMLPSPFIHKELPLSSLSIFQSMAGLVF